MCTLWVPLFVFLGDNQAIHDALVQQQTTTTVGIMARSSGHIFAAAAASLVAADEDAATLLVDESAAAPQPSNSSKGEAVVIIPTHESLMAIKHKKKLLTNGTEQFNMKPSKVTSFNFIIFILKHVNVYYLNAVLQH